MNISNLTVLTVIDWFNMSINYAPSSEGKLGSQGIVTHAGGPYVERSLIFL